MKLEEYIKGYTCNAQTNNALHKEFTAKTEAISFLQKHRLYIEENKLGFGDRAFHYMWSLLLQRLFEVNKNPRLLEIGVFKGQVISLWALIAKEEGKECRIEGVTPLSGNSAPKIGLLYYFKFFTSRKFREDSKAGNFYGNENYLDIISSVFQYFNLDFSKVKIHKGLSSEARILENFTASRFDLIYIDGDHAKEAVELDIQNFASKINIGGFLVMDDASSNLPGGENNEYWKGHQSVSDACDIIPDFGFENVLNIGHNRVYQKVK